MSTRGIYHFRDEDRGIFRVYSQFDNYPKGAFEYITEALRLAWPLPRFEADEFACAFIAANKDSHGGFRLVPHNVTDMGQDYDYYISLADKELLIEFLDCDLEGNPMQFSGNLKKMADYIKSTEEN